MKCLQVVPMFYLFKRDKNYDRKNEAVFELVAWSCPLGFEVCASFIDGQRIFAY